MKSVGAVWEDLQAGSDHHSGAAGFVPVVDVDWFPEVSSQHVGCAVAEGVALWLQQSAERHFGQLQGTDRALRRVLTRGDCVVVAAVAELSHPHWLWMTETLWMSSHSYLPPHSDSSGKVWPLGQNAGS